MKVEVIHEIYSRLGYIEDNGNYWIMEEDRPATRIVDELQGIIRYLERNTLAEDDSPEAGCIRHWVHELIMEAVTYEERVAPMLSLEWKGISSKIRSIKRVLLELEHLNPS